MKKIKKIWVIVLAGGKRALDEAKAPHRPKLLEDVCGTPVLHYVLRAAEGIRAAKVVGITAIISSRFDEVIRDSLHDFSSVKIAVQENPRGTAEAVWQAIKQGAYPLTDEADFVVILMGDQPLVTSEDLDELIECYLSNHLCRAGILTFEENRQHEEYKKCGIIIRDSNGCFQDVQTWIPITSQRKEELHAGPYIIQAGWLHGILTLSSELQHYSEGTPEFHLYAALLAARDDTGVFTCLSQHPKNFLGVDTWKGLEEVRRRMLLRLK